MENRFKVGDEVVVVDDIGYSWPQKGLTGIVVEVRGISVFRYRVRYTCETGRSAKDNSYKESDLELDIIMDSPLMKALA